MYIHICTYTDLRVDNPSCGPCGVLVCKSKHSNRIINTAFVKANRSYGALMNIPKTQWRQETGQGGRKQPSGNPNFNFCKSCELPATL